MNRFRVWLNTSILLSLFINSGWVFASNQSLTLGVYAYREPIKVEQQFRPLVDYLNRNISGASIHLKVLNIEEFKQALRKHQVDLLLVNPTLYELVRNENSLSGVIATIQRIRKGDLTSSLGGVVFAKASRHDIQSYQDLNRLRIAIPSKSNMGAYLAPIYGLQKAGIDINRLNLISVGNNDAVVASVLSGKTDVGFVRTGILEAWQSEGHLNLDKIKILHQRKLRGFPYLVSTSLYPEWPFVVLSNVKENITRQLIVALFDIKPDSLVAKQMNIAGFVPPMDYLSVQNLLIKLHLPPYDFPPEFNWKSFWHVYHIPILLLLILFIVIVIALVGTSALSANLREQTSRLGDILEATRSGSWEWEVQTGRLILNQRWAEMIGYRLEELEPISIKTWENSVHPEDLKKSNVLLQRHFEGTLDYYETEVRLRHKNGHWVWVLDRGMVIKRNAKGLPLKMSGTHTDISRQKENEAMIQLKANRDEVLLQLPHLLEDDNESQFLSEALQKIKPMLASDYAFIQMGAFIDHESKRADSSDNLIVGLGELDYAFSQVVEHQIKEVEQSAQQLVQEGRLNLLLNPEADLKEQVVVRRYFILPIVEQGKVVGVFGFANKPDPYNKIDVETAKILGHEVWRLVLNSRIQMQSDQQRQQYQRLVNEIGDNYVVFSSSAKEGALQYISDSVEKVFGLDKDDVIGRPWMELVEWEPASLQSALAYKQSMRQGEMDFNEFMMHFRHAQDGQECIIRVMMHAVRDEQDELVGMDGLIENVTDKVRIDNELQEAASVFEYAQEGIMITNADAKILDVNAAFIRITGYEREDVLGKNPNMLSSGRQGKHFYAEFWRELLATGQWSGEIWNRRKNGEEFPEKVTISAVKDQQGKLLRFIALFSDISVQKKQQQQLEYIAHYDSLTGLPNRSLLTDRISQAMVYCNRHHLNMAVVFIDLDGFKAVNDIYGHQTGDRLLVEISKRFKQSLRESDTIARLGGDEFVAVIADFSHRDDVQMVFERLLEDANEPVVLGDNNLGVSASIGVSFYRQGDDLDADQIMRQADQAMYQAKLKGKNQIYIFEGSDQIAQSAELLALEAALKKHQLCLFYQPKVNMRTGEVLGCEALLRWNHPEKGYLLPSAFLPLLGDHPLGIRLGYWVIEQALEQMCFWQKEHGEPIRVSVNVEGDLLQDEQFVNNLAELLQKYPRVKSGWLTLEILESSAIEDVFTVSNIINECRKLGVYFSIDDFGTGYASLTYLKNLPVHELKIDKSFVQDLSSDLQSLAIMQSLVSMGQAFNLNVIAEGVETDQQAAMLMKLGFESAQGFRIAKPMQADSVLDWLNAWEVFPHWQTVEKMEDAKGLGLVAVIAEHETWVERVKRFVESESSDLPPMHPSECRFGRWLHGGDAVEVLGDQLEVIDQLHQQVHMVGEQVVSLKEIEDEEGAHRKFEELTLLKNRIVNKLEGIVENLVSTPPTKH